MMLNLCRILFVLFLTFLIFVSCSKSEKASVKQFRSPDEAVAALVAAAKSGDRNTIIAILGPDSREVISSGDPVEDKNVVSAFSAKYDAMHRFRRMEDGVEVLLVGADNFPFPIPLKKNAVGRWFFDTQAGKQEVLARRIGRDELAIIRTCRAVADAEAQYYSQLHDGDTTHHYAMKFISAPGKQDGLYWQSPENQPKSPLGPLVAFATSEGYSTNSGPQTAFHGYYFHLLRSQGDKAPGGAIDYFVNGKMTRGFALVAYPVTYGNSGVMTFIINQGGLLLQRDFGESTTQTATAMTQFAPDANWTVVGE